MSRRPKLARVESPAPRARALGRLLTAALRHEPARLGLGPDAQGWVEVERVLAALHAEPEWADVGLADLEAACVAGAKTRLEIVEGRIRARYGHSLPDRLDLPPAIPPERLYHGTAEVSVAAILAEGLKPMGRQYVHLSEHLPRARAIGYRKSAAHPALLEVAAGAMARAGHVFHEAGDGVWLTTDVAPQFITRVPGR
jgi:putative RNA 2'-phosphotransferase